MNSGRLLSYLDLVEQIRAACQRGVHPHPGPCATAEQREALWREYEDARRAELAALPPRQLKGD